MNNPTKRPHVKAKKRKALRVPLASGADRADVIDHVSGAEDRSAIEMEIGAEARAESEPEIGADGGNGDENYSGADAPSGIADRHGADPVFAIAHHRGAERRRAIEDDTGAASSRESVEVIGAAARPASEHRTGAEPATAIGSRIGAERWSVNERSCGAEGGGEIARVTGADVQPATEARSGAETVSAIDTGPGADRSGASDIWRGTDSSSAIARKGGVDSRVASAKLRGAEKGKAIAKRAGAESAIVSAARRGAGCCAAIDARHGANFSSASEKANGADVRGASDHVGGAVSDAVARQIIASMQGALAKSGGKDTESEIPGEEDRPRYRIKTREDFADEATFRLYKYAYLYRLFQKMRKAADQLALESMGDTILEQMPAHLQWLEELYAKGLTKTLRSHVLWPWLQQYPGLAGVHMAMVLALIADPRRFPRPGGRGTGVRSVWHYFGLHCDANGGFAWAGKGTQSTWNKKGRTAFLQPSGIVDAIVKARTPVYREYMDAQKARLAAERGLVEKPATAPKDFVKKYRQAHPREPGKGPLFPFEVHKIAMKIVAKRILGDVLIEWKRRLAATVAA